MSTVEIDLCEGKYTVVYDHNTHELKALRYGDMWRDLTGDRMIHAMFDEIVELRSKLNYAHVTLDCLKDEYK